jgi:hypothetical protein
MGIETAPAHQSPIGRESRCRWTSGICALRAIDLRSIWVIAAPFLIAFLAVGIVGAYRYVDNFWLYRGFAAPRDPAFVQVHGRQETISVVSPALGGRSQQVGDVQPGEHDELVTGLDAVKPVGNGGIELEPRLRCAFERLIGSVGGGAER